MPLNSKGKKIRDEMQEHYGKKKGKQVFYASENAGKLEGVKLASWKSVLKQEPIMEKLEGLLRNWKPESEEGQAYQNDLENVVKEFCPEGSEWCPKCKQCETPEEAKEIHGE